MPGPMHTVHDVGEASDRNSGRETFGVNLIRLRNIDRVDAEPRELLGILGLSPRIVGQIFGIVELFGVHENCHDHPIAEFLCGRNKREMPVMQSAHGGHDAHAFLGEMPTGGHGAQLGQLAHDRWWRHGVLHLDGALSLKVCSDAGTLRARTSSA